MPADENGIYLVMCRECGIKILRSLNCLPIWLDGQPLINVFNLSKIPVIQINSTPILLPN